MRGSSCGLAIGKNPTRPLYCEGESEHLPASLPIALAQALNVTTDELLGVRPSRKLASVSTRLERRIKQIERMPTKPKQQLLGIIDTFRRASVIAHPKPINNKARNAGFVGHGSRLVATVTFSAGMCNQPEHQST